MEIIKETMSKEVVELFTAMAKVQGLFSVIEKTKDGYGYKYADLECITEMIKPLFKEHGLFFWQDLAPAQGGVLISTTIAHRSGQWKKSDPLYVPLVPNKKTNAAQEMGVIVTYGKRYSLCATLGIITKDEDTDGAYKGDYGQPGKQYPPQQNTQYRPAPNYNKQRAQENYRDMTQGSPEYHHQNQMEQYNGQP